MRSPATSIPPCACTVRTHRYAFRVSGSRHATAFFRPSALSPAPPSSARAAATRSSSSPTTRCCASAIRRADVAETREEDAGAAVFDEMLERALHHGERELVPGDFVLAREAHFEALDARRNVRIQQ